MCNILSKMTRYHPRHSFGEPPRAAYNRGRNFQSISLDHASGFPMTIALRQTFLLLLCGLALPAAKAFSAENALSDAEKKSGWKLLFDGQSTKGWRNYKS